MDLVPLDPKVPEAGDIVISVRKMLARYQIHPRKRLGQSFLEDTNIIRRIVDLTEPVENQTIIEIGAGLGQMTEQLAEKAGKVIAIEIDPRLAEILRGRFSGSERVDVLEMDVLKFDFSSVCQERKIKIVGNIPYHISSPILFRLLEYRRSISTMILMFQKELADRIMASPGTKDYGLPSVMVASCARIDCPIKVPPTCFYPVPAVFSSVLRFTFRNDLQIPDEALFAQIVRTAFAQRRKTLWNNLRRTGLPEGTVELILEESQIDRTRRAETLSVDEFSRLTRAWIENNTADRPQSSPPK